ncbi:LysR family transcriptional regulator [Actinophytocola algeriensis]|uniref:DNA-binding transcriptional LysR family regulator n=1 Tax=Actinophytocola algeriensis TaxID=1768010 RepID=A0A7W7QEM8_9PSEU|nr:LysR family transcriptional regulator [Actinophytocola algeriensis]MBB4911899.1 DNA-binding transcriptional LysR family regulator [Actinophytocola algeriensis]MBE1477609.1 DNA-binding transcriptional LysR family regulator [Actinophytocola algeriensis]
MELRQLECFLAVVDEGTFTAAAARLRVVQSAVSSTIKALERSLGVSLFDRGPGRPALTDAGHRLVPEARRMLDLAATAAEAVRTELTGELRVGVMSSVGPVDLPGVLARYRAVHPRVRVHVKVMPRGSADLSGALRTGRLDVAFISAPATPDLALTLIARDPMFLLFPPGHPLADAPLSLADLAHETWIDGPEGFGNRTIVDAAFTAAGFTREVALEVADSSWVPGFVAAGLGIGFVPTGIAIPETVHKRQLAELRWPLYVATTKDRADRPSVRAFTELVRAG